VAHDLNLNPPCKERRESMPAFVFMIEKYCDNTRYDDENIKPHLIFDLVWLLKTREHEKFCRICTRAQ
jgi:hypothetical protein